MPACGVPFVLYLRRRMEDAKKRPELWPLFAAFADVSLNLRDIATSTLERTFFFILQASVRAGNRTMRLLAQKSQWARTTAALKRAP